MLKKWIENIKKQRDHYKCDSWKYHISGNSLELSVLPAHSKNIENYRCAVINIGQVIQALAYQIEKSGLQFHIQSFPSLENPSLVATVRIDKKGNTRFYNTENIYTIVPDLVKTEEICTMMKKIAERFQLRLEESKPEWVTDLTPADISEEPKQFTLFSEYDNPFTWLKIGYWKEMIYGDCKNHLDENRKFLISDFCVKLDRKNFVYKSQKREYIQAILFLYDN